MGGGVVLPPELDGVGNTPTEDLLHTLSRTGVVSDDLFEAVADAAADVSDRLGVGANSHVVRGGTAEHVLRVMGAED